MSIAPLGPCSKCKTALTFEFVARMSAENESSYGVSWICTTCQSRALDVCPLGPVIPTTNCCLNCGSAPDGDAKCSGCGVREAGALEWFGIADGLQLDAAERDLSDGLIRRALGRANHLLRRDPGLADAWEFKAQIYQQLGFHAAAARMLSHAATASNRPLMLVSAGFSLQELQQHGDAIELFRAFLATAPVDESAAAAAWCNLGNSLSVLNRDAEAEDALKRALELEPARATHAINYAALLQKLGRSQEALEVLKRGLRSPTDSQARMSLLLALSHAHAELEDGAAALAAAEAALALDERSTAARYLLGRALGLLGNLELAIEAMKQILTADPGHADAKRALAMLERAVAASSSTQGEPATADHARRPWWRFWSSGRRR